MEEVRNVVHTCLPRLTARLTWVLIATSVRAKHNCFNTEETVQDVVTVLGVIVSEFQEAQENMGRIGNRYHSVEPW